MKHITYMIAAIGVVFLLCGFKIEQAPEEGIGQPLDERTAQDALPQSQDDLWNKFAKCKVKLIEDDAKDIYQYSINFTPEVKAMEGKELTISGFMLPLESTEKFHHFILSKRTPTCPFCPPGEPNEIVDVWTSDPVEWSEYTVSVTGKFSFTNDQKIGMFFKLADAKLFAPHPLKAKEQIW